MSVHAVKRIHGQGRLEFACQAADILISGHPLNKLFVKWLDGKQPTKRQARNYLAIFPTWRKVKVVK